MAASRAECVESRWSAHGVTKGANKVKEDVSDAHIAVFREATNASKRNISIILLELKAVLKRVSAQIKIKGLTAIMRIQIELEHDDSEALQNVAN